MKKLGHSFWGIEIFKNRQIRNAQIIYDKCEAVTPEKIADLCLYRAQGGGKFSPPLKIFQLQYAGVEYDSNNLLEGAQEYL